MRIERSEKDWLLQTAECGCKIEWALFKGPFGQTELVKPVITFCNDHTFRSDYE